MTTASISDETHSQPRRRGFALAISILVLTGIGIGPFFSLPMVVVQNALPAERLGIGAAGLRYLGQLGASLGIAIVGTVVTSSVSGDPMSRLPTGPASKLALAAALQHGFLAVLIFALIALMANFFLKEASTKTTRKALSPDQAAQADEASEKELIHAWPLVNRTTEEVASPTKAGLATSVADTARLARCSQ